MLSGSFSLFLPLLDLLFMLTGWRTAEDAASPHPRAAIRLARRGALRFLPLHLFGLAVAIPCALGFRALGFSTIGSTPSIDVLSLSSCLFLVNGWFPARIFLGFWNPLLWIFGDGLLWLLAAPAMLRLLRRLSRRRPAMAMAVLWCLSLALATVLQFTLPPVLLDADTRTWAFLCFPPLRLWEFAFGALARLAFRRKFPQLTRAEQAGLLLTAALASFLWPRLPFGLHSFWSAPCWALFLLAGSCGPAVLPLPLRRLKAILPASLLLCPWSFWLSVGLEHLLLLRRPELGSTAFSVALFLTLTAALATAVHRFIEVPGRHLLERLWPAAWADQAMPWREIIHHLRVGKIFRKSV